VKGKSGSGKLSSDVTVADELDLRMKTRHFVKPEDQLDLSDQV
jgi:hypothetical protein